MKKILTLLLAMILAFSCVSCTGKEVSSGSAEVSAKPAEANTETEKEAEKPAETNDKPAETKENVLPQIGEVINGFEVKEIREFPLVGADLVLFEHQKTGSKLLWIANEDRNRAFQLSFNTRPFDDTGLPHVFEHATLFGSKKYPSTAFFFNVSYQTYNTYINAYTMDAMTGFPIASLSEKQLLSLADYYVDSCFNPNIMTDEGIFRTQAWHYSLPDLESELKYEGVVYSEMQGSMTLSRTALDNANRLTFPGASLSFNYGGIPKNIPEMTWEDVKGFHDKYYHPSNCFSLLYGQIDDYASFLELLNEAFAPYEKVDFSFEESGYKEITKPVTTEIGYPMAEGTDVTNQTVIFYYILCPGMKGDKAQEYLIDHVCSLLNERASVLHQSFEKAFPAGSVSCGRETAAPVDAVVFAAYGMNRGDAEQFKALVDDAIRDVAENGFPQDMVDSAMTVMNISTKLAPENGNPVEGVMRDFAYKYAVTGNPFEYSENTAALSSIDKENRDGLLKEATGRWLLNRELCTLTTTYPDPGEKEKQDAALKEKLAKIKAGMTQEELQAIVNETNAAPKDEDTTELMTKIKVVTVDSLPEEVRTYTVSDFTDKNGIRHVEAPAGVDGIGNVSLLFDASALPQEDIHWMRLYTRLLGQLDTDRHTREELDVLIPRYLYNKSTGVNVLEAGTGIIHPYMGAGWYALDDDLAAGYELMEELLFHTRFDNTQKLKDRVQEQKTIVRTTINNNVFDVMLYRGLSDAIPLYRYCSYLSYIEYYEFLEKLESMLKENPEEVTKHLEAIQAFFNNNAGAIVTFAGNEKSIELNRPLADAFMAKLDHAERESVTYDLPVCAQKEALIIDGNIQYNNVFATLDDLGLTEYDAGLGVVTALMTDRVLTPVLRDQMGVYTPMSGMIDEDCLYMITDRDPNVKETFDVYASLADRITEMDVDQDTLDGYIMSCYSGLALPQGELTGAINAINDVLNEKTPDRYLNYMRQLKAVTPDTVKRAAEILRKAWENGVHSTAGSASAINKNADLYDVILNPFNAQDASQVKFTDAVEGSNYYDAVRFAFENGLMAPKADDAFGTEDPATAGDFFGAMYVLTGGASGAIEDAMTMFAGYGLVPGGMDSATELTAGTTAGLFSAVSAALGAPWEPELDPGTEEETITRGRMAQMLSEFVNSLQ